MLRNEQELKELVQTLIQQNLETLLMILKDHESRLTNIETRLEYLGDRME